MGNIDDVFDPGKYYFADTSFQLLMKKRIINVLLICSTYDYFMLEEDGRIDEQIFNEYVSLSLRYPPMFLHAATIDEAAEILERGKIDLVMIMLSLGDPFSIAKKIKEQYAGVPIVLLVPFSREISLKLTEENLQPIDYVFSWLGNASLLLAVIKLIEDKMNVEHDVEEVGVQTIILVEDSIRYYSVYLPVLFKMIFKQSTDFMTEGLNEHQKMLRMRGRPKVLLANTYEQALALYQKYKNNLLGIISDISYPKNGEEDPKAGITLCEKVRADDEFIPFLLQSSDAENAKIAKKLKVGFIHKFSKTLNLELKKYINDHFLFGDFIFRDPKTQKEIARASGIQALQQTILDVPDDSLQYHIEQNHISKWLKARAFFPIAEMLKPMRPEDFRNIDAIRKYLFDTIASFRFSKARGIIAEFYREKFDEYLIFTRIGEGSIGGKARGLAFIDSLVKRNRLYDKYEGVTVTIPLTVVLTTDVFDEFMAGNNLYQIALSDAPDEEILKHFLDAKLPFRIHEDLYTFIRVVKNPIAVRSSSLLEDSHYQPFAGVYSTYMIPKVESNDQLTIEILSDAIKSVYASAFYKASKAYMAATSNVIDEEKMAVVLQEVCGNMHGERFYPTISGVARSINYYPIPPEKPEDGIVNVALGLGKYVVDGGISLRFSPRYPENILQLSTPEMALKDTQKYFYALNLSVESFVPSTDDAINLVKLKVQEAEEDGALKDLVSTYDFQNNVLRDGMLYDGKRIVTFANILKYNTFPLSTIVKEVLDIAQKEMGNPIEIEFAVNLYPAKGGPKIFNLLQIRPIVETQQDVDAKIEKIKKEDAIIISDSALGNGEISGIFDIVYIKPECFESSASEEIAVEVDTLNQLFLKEKKNYVLIGPGRWGSSDQWLGIPVKWTQVSAARVIIESGLENYRIDPSQGSHFFQNITSFRIGYFTINPFINDGYYDVDYLNSLDAVSETDYIRHVRFKEPLTIKIDGQKSKGIILKPGSKS